MPFSNLTYSIIFFILFLASCNSSQTETSTTTDKPNLALAKTPIHSIEFYSDANEESMENLLNKTIEANKTPILFFTAGWCKPCKEFKASMKYDQVAQSLKDATMIIVDVDKDKKKESHASDYGVRAIPTFIIVDKKGNAINTITGAAWAENTPNNIAKAMEEFLDKEG